MSARIEPITDANVEAVVELLMARNRTRPDYTRWKYGDRGPAGARGVLARIAGRPVGCFGLVARPLQLSSGKEIVCGWFADWFVLPSARGTGLGAALLEALSEQAAIILGHPVPPAAAAICRRGGFEPLAFQSRRRLVLRGLSYERERTRYAVKAMARWAVAALDSRVQRALARRDPGPPSGRAPAYADLSMHADWMARQPTAAHVQRTWGSWTGDGLSVTYADVDQPGMRLRRVILHSQDDSSGEGAWVAFVEDARRRGCMAIDGFTTNPRLDQTWQALGGRVVAEPPVLIKGAPGASPMMLHGWDRENWTYLAAERPPASGRHEPERLHAESAP